MALVLLYLFCVTVYFVNCYGCMFAFVVLHLISSVLSQEIGWEERLQNDLFCIGWYIKP